MPHDPAMRNPTLATILDLHPGVSDYSRERLLHSYVVRGSGEMQRILVIGQAGPFGQAWCRLAATRLAHRLSLPCLPATESLAGDSGDRGWVAMAQAGHLSGQLLAAADTAVWLHFSPAEVTRAWLRGLRTRLRDALAMRRPRLADISGSLAHMAWTPHLGRLFTDSAQSHLQVFHLRTPDEAEFWLHLQEQRLPSFGSSLAQAA